MTANSFGLRPFADLIAEPSGPITLRRIVRQADTSEIRIGDLVCDVAADPNAVPVCSTIWGATAPSNPGAHSVVVSIDGVGAPAFIPSAKARDYACSVVQASALQRFYIAVNGVLTLADIGKRLSWLLTGQPVASASRLMLDPTGSSFPAFTIVGLAARPDFPSYPAGGIAIVTWNGSPFGVKAL